MKYILISYFENQFSAVSIGNFAGNKSKHELNIKVDTENVLFSNMEITKFNIVAIYVKDYESSDMHQFPLVGYYNVIKNSKWRNRLISYFASKKSESKANVQPNKTQDDFHNINQKIEYKEEKKTKDYKEQKKEIVAIQNDNNNYFKYLKNNNFDKINDIMTNIKGATEFKPFERSKLKYKWWKISDIKFLDNIFKNSLMANQIFKHPLIKKKLREYGYCLYGLVSDVNDNIKYISFGLPSKYYTNDQIYIGGFSVFYPAQGFEKKNGDFGYWVVHIKVDNQNIVMTV